MKKYYAICKRCGDEVVSFHSGLSPCNHIWCGGLVFCYPKKRRRTKHAPDKANASEKPNSVAVYRVSKEITC